MNKSHVKGKFNEVKGKVKEEVGHSTGRDKMAGEGVADQLKGKIQKKFGDFKDAVKEKVDSVLSSDKNQQRSA